MIVPSPSAEGQTPIDYDVAIIGGGPGGSTTGSLLKKYRPQTRVIILEKERFPRDHIGESQLPPIGRVLDEMGCWEKVEAADFPIKVGATFRWGSRPELWDFELIPINEFKDEPRPAPYAGQRRHTALQVDRSIYDTILLDHAASLGCVVHQETQVTGIERDGDRVTALTLRDGSVVTARYYVDASGYSGFLRRAMDVKVTVPTSLQNIAIWDYWRNAEWAVNIGVGGTRIQVMSQPHGWLWFIPLGPTRTSLGFVCPAEHYKKMGLAPEPLYLQAVQGDARISALVRNASREGRIYTTKDWSFCAERTYGENWFMVGEAAGFADPILSAGLTLTHTGARELAYTIIAMEEGAHDAAWMKRHYDINQRARVLQHIRFADFWYAANGQFVDLKDNCANIAREAGLRLNPEGAWRWLAQGGFANDFHGQAGIGGFDLAGAKQITQILVNKDVTWQLSKVNVLKFNLDRATREQVPVYDQGRISSADCYSRRGHRLVLVGVYRLLADVIRQFSDVATIYESLTSHFRATMAQHDAHIAVQHVMSALEVLLSEGWVVGSLNRKRPMLSVRTPREGRMIHPNRDEITVD